MKRYLLLLFVFAVPSLLFAGTLLELSKKGYDPYLADRDGFDSLFVNPAGISGDTEAFSLAVEAGTWGELENYKFLKDNIDAITSMASGGSLSQEDAASLLPLMLAEIDQATWTAITSGAGGNVVTVSTDLATAQTIDWSDPVQAPLTDLAIIADNLAADSVAQEAVMNQFDSVVYSVEAEVRLGTLIKGFGFGLYGNTYFLYSLGAQGIQDMIFETGAVAAYGFDLGSSFSLGFSGKFALLLADDPMYPFSIAQGDIKNQQILYGYAWGVNAGLIWEPVNSFRMALLFSDIIGSVTPVDDMASGTVGDFLSGNIAGPSGDYAWNIDVSTGLSWQPDWRVIRPKFSLDFYDLVGLYREYNDANYTSLKDLYSADSNPILWHMRAGANLRFFNFLDVGTSYYREYLSLGVGIDIAFIEAFVEVKTKQNFSDVGGNAMLKIKF